MINTLLYLSLSSAANVETEPLRNSPYQNGFGISCSSSVMIADCQQMKCLPTGRYITVCSLCRTGLVPINGVCVNQTTAHDYGDISVCQKNDETNPTHCISCSKNGSSNNYFLFYGGCYLATRWPGNSYCLSASNGVCTSCNTNAKMVFTNPNTTAQEKCILCSDNIGFGGSKGIQGCADCMNRNSAGSTDIQCLRCKAYDTAPIDDACIPFGRHICADGHCTRCYKTHIFHLGGCFTRGGPRAEAVCASNNQFEIGDYSACKACVNTSEAPDQGNCKKHSEQNKCTKSSTGSCSDCLHSNPGSTFLFYGGCYDATDVPGRLICSTSSGGSCTSVVNNSGVYLNGRACYFCNDTANGGISNCLTCSYESNAVVCSRCGSGTARSLDGRECLSDCVFPLRKYCSNDVCICECEVGHYLSGNTCLACHESCAFCTGPSADQCEACTQGWLWRYDENNHLTCVGVDGCGDGFYPDVAESACMPCDINRCKTCVKQSNVLCTECSTGYISLNETVCVDSCAGEYMEPSATGARRCICQEGYTKNADSSRCVPVHPCPSDTSGCSRCDSAGYCMKCTNTDHVIQLGRKSCTSECPLNSSPLYEYICVCNEGSVLTNGTCTIVPTTTSGVPVTTMIIAIAVIVIVVIVGVLVGVLCWYFLRNKRKRSIRPRTVSKMSESMGLVGSVDDF